VGFGFGDAVILEILESKGLLPTDLHAAEAPEVVCSSDSAELYGRAVLLAASLRAGGVPVELILEPRRLKHSLRRADKLGASKLHLVSVCLSSHAHALLSLSLCVFRIFSGVL
jgi:histidyl-tRNA synthetase